MYKTKIELENKVKETKVGKMKIIEGSVGDQFLPSNLHVKVVVMVTRYLFKYSVFSSIFLPQEFDLLFSIFYYYPYHLHLRPIVFLRSMSVYLSVLFVQPKLQVHATKATSTMF